MHRSCLRKSSVPILTCVNFLSVLSFTSANDIDDLKQMLNATMTRVNELEKWKKESTYFDSGHTAWVLTSSTLVLLMSLPGLALFYGGMAQVKNVLSTVFQTFSIACLISVLWFMFGYSLAFGTGSGVFGGSSRFWLLGDESTIPRIGVQTKHPLAPHIPETVYMMFQLGFAVITAAIVCGSFAERMRFRSMLAFITLWHLLVYCPVAHSVWAKDGFLARAGCLDFAGGDVVHVCAGFSGLAASVAVGPRAGFGVEELRPHNVVYTLIGGSLIWVGWFGFNGGSALRADGRAGFAVLTTQISAATCALAWMATEWRHRGKPSVLGIVCGAVSGLVIVTPGAGYVDQTGAFCMGLIGAPIVYFGLQAKHHAGYDDALDAFGVHGMGGIVGCILTGYHGLQLLL
jgi:ammonium transporter, Amt family